MEKKNHKEKHIAYKEKAETYLSVILSALNGIKELADQENYSYSKPEIASLFNKIDLGIKSAKAHFLLNGQNVSFYSESWKRDGDVVRCIETNEFFTTTTLASRLTGVNNGNLGRALNGALPGSGGQHWEYFNLYLYTVPLTFKKAVKKCELIDMDSGKTYTSVREACAKLGLPERLVYMCLFHNRITRDLYNPYMRVNGHCLAIYDKEFKENNE